MKRFNIIPYFISMEGCTGRCIYCNQFSVKGHGTKKPEILDYVLNERVKYKDRENLELALYGGTFFNLPEKDLQYYRDKISELKSQGIIKNARASTTPESVNKRVLQMFQGVIDRVELGVQTLDDYILKIIRRRYTKKEVFLATELLKIFNFEVGFQIMAGLPYEGITSFIKTVNDTIEMKPKFVRLYPLFVLKNTLLSVYYGLGIFKPVTMEELIRRVGYAVAKFETAGIKVIKIGLNEFISDNSIDFIHHHNDLKGLIMSYVFKKAVLNYLNKENITGDLEVSCNKSDIHYLKGIRKENLYYFRKTGLNLMIKEDHINKYHIQVGDKQINLLNEFLKDSF